MNSEQNSHSTLSPLLSSMLDDDIVVSLLPNYIQTVERCIAEVEAHLLKQDWKSLKGIAHQLKGTGGAYGFSVLTSLAGDLECEAGMSTVNEEKITVLAGQLVQLGMRIKLGADTLH